MMAVDWKKPLAAAVMWVVAGLPVQAWGFAGVLDEKVQKALSDVGSALSSGKPLKVQQTATTGLGAKGAKSSDEGAADQASAQSARTGADVYAFKPSAAVSEQVREEVIQQLAQAAGRKGMAPQAQKQLQQQLRDAFGKVDIDKVIGDPLRKKGFDPHNVVTATTYWLLTNYSIAQEVVSTDTQNKAVLAQMRERMDASPDLAAMGHAQKQRMAEGLYWFALLQQFAQEQAQKGVAGYERQAVAQDAGDALKVFGIDAERLRLSDQGLVPR